MNLPNKITLSRIVMIPLFVVVFYLGDLWRFCPLIAAAVFLIAAFTDFLDGHIARKYGLVTNMGKFLDPIADKVLVSTAFILMLTRPTSLEAGGMAGWGLVAGGVCVAVILARELIVSGFRLIAAGQNIVLAADKLGKIKTVLQDAAIAVLLSAMPFVGEPAGRVFAAVGMGLLFACTAATVVSGIRYIVCNRQVLSDSEQKNAEEENRA